MGLLTFSINVTLDGCVDHQEGIADDETHAFFTRLRAISRTLRTSCSVASETAYAGTETTATVWPFAANTSSS